MTTMVAMTRTIVFVASKVRFALSASMVGSVRRLFVMDSDANTVRGVNLIQIQSVKCTVLSGETKNVIGKGDDAVSNAFAM
jgi:hypothetical protein